MENRIEELKTEGQKIDFEVISGDIRGGKYTESEVNDMRKKYGDGLWSVLRGAYNDYWRKSVDKELKMLRGQIDQILNRLTRNDLVTKKNK